MIPETSPSPKTAIIARHGEFWTIVHDGKSFSLIDIRGLTYLQRLLQYPGKEFHSLDLVRGTFAHEEHRVRAVAPDEEQYDPAHLPEDTELTQSTSGGDPGLVIDYQAIKEYRRKLSELEEDFAEAKKDGNIDLAEKIESDIDFLKAEVNRSLDKKRRPRRFVSDAERARTSVQRAIRSALEKISQNDKALGAILDGTIRTGNFCSYNENPRLPLVWRFSSKVPAQAEAYQPIQPLPQSSFLRGLTDRTTFVGREAERARLRRALEDAKRGVGGVKMIVGPAGVGKTRIAAEMGAEAAAKGFRTLFGACYDREDTIPFIPFVEILETALTQAADLQNFREVLGADAAEMARFLPQLRRVFPEIPAAPERPPEQSRRILLKAVTEIIARSSRNQPLLLLLDDLHWADDGTLALLTHLANAVARMPVLLVGTYRDSEVESSGQLVKALDELVRLHLLDWITLGGLPPQAVADMLRALSGREPPASIVALMYSETEGNPFFVEELYRHLSEIGQLTDETGEFRRDLKLSDIDVPQGVRVVIGRRLARLSDDTQKVLRTAAVIGRSFTLELLEASVEADAEELLESVEEAEQAGLILSSAQHPEIRFRFSHELIRQVVAAGFTAIRARRLHLNVADAIERVYANTLEEHAEDLAHHLSQAGASADVSRVVRSLEMAARRSREQGAFDRAERYLRNALQSLERLPSGKDRSHQELAITLGLSAVLISSKGHAAAEPQALFARMLELSDSIEDPALTFPLQLQIWASVTVRGEHSPQARALSDRLLPLTDYTAVPIVAMLANLIRGITFIDLGEFVPARIHLERALGLYDPKFRSSSGMFQDPAILALTYLARDLWYLGYPDQALAKAQEGIALATETQDYHDLAHAYTFGAIVHLYRHEGAPAFELCEKAVTLSREHSLTQWEGMGMIFGGGCLIELGHVQEGMVRLMEGINLYSSTGALTGITYWGVYFAEGHLKAGNITAALELLKEYPSLIAEHGEGALESEIYRLMGEALLRQREPDQQAAAASFDKAISVARGLCGKSPELRATMSLARLLRTQGKREEARRILAEIYGWFSEGFETGDLRDARALLDELSASAAQAAHR